MKDYVEVFRHLQPFEVEKVLSALQGEGISCYMEAAGPWGRAPVTNAADSLSAPANSYYVMVLKDQFDEAREIVSGLLRGGVPTSPLGLGRSRMTIRPVHMIGVLLGLVFIVLLVLLTIWQVMGK
jgi:hypothetical protein